MLGNGADVTFYDKGDLVNITQDLRTRRHSRSQDNEAPYPNGTHPKYRGPDKREARGFIRSSSYDDRGETLV